LDELSGHSSAWVPLFLCVWTVAALLLALLLRWAGAGRLTAGLLLAAAVCGWQYAVNGVSILVVRQIPAHAAFHAAAAERAVAIPAVLAGIAGALFGRSGVSGKGSTRIVLACLTAAVGLLAALDGVLPEHRRSLVTALDAAHVHGLSKALIVPLSIALLLTARHLARGSRRAWRLALVLLALLLALNVERQFGDGAIVTGLTVVGLLARRADFDRRGDPSSRRRVAWHAVALSATIAGYGVIALWVNRLMADQPYTLSYALRLTGRAVAGLNLRGADSLNGPLADWFPLSVFLLGVGSLLFVLVEWLAPWRYRLHRQASELELVRSLVAQWGADTLAPFALREDKSYFFSDDRSAFVAYRVVGGVAIVSGDPIGREEAREDAIRSFLAFARNRCWRVGVLGASEEYLQLYESLGLRALYHGDEAVVDCATFSLDGRAIRKVRQSVHRLERAGYTARVLTPSEVDQNMRVELEAIGRAWRGAAPERGFAMALDALFGSADGDALFMIGFDSDGRPRGFLHFAVCPAGSALSLSSMPRLSDVPNGFMEWLICEAIAYARDHGFARVSLNFSPFAALLAPTQELSVGQRVQAATLRRLKGHFQLDNLLLFNRKFFPTWQRRFVIYENRRDLLRVGVAALAVEAYLPFQ
ncbi:MAG TPA: phosphatidylglycerol lysyltransferase domain-containing protein, partial [Gaiellaceae bacterium]|nr:phosphatidylglycerol lysyltransferase domain-containing protein [Gaiellaceae bacterium]